MNDVKEELSSLDFWDKLRDDEKQASVQASSLRSFNKNEMISSSCLGMLKIISGTLRVYILSEEGRDITLFRLKPGDVCVMSASCVISQLTFETQIVAETEAKALVLNSSDFLWLTDNNIYARCYMYELLTKRFSSVMWTMQQILFLGFDKRLASYLVSEYERTGSQKIKTTQEQIAKDIGSAREVVTRMLKRFSSDNLISVSRGMILIKNIDGLKKILI